jgi:SAM-dependent methyltransferase
MKAAALDRLLNLQAENELARADMAAQAGRFDRLRGRHTNGAAPLAVSAFQLFQTPPAIAARLCERAGIRPGARVLEPSAGLGRLLDAVGPYAPAEVVAVEVSPDCAGALFKTHPGARLLQRDFLTVEPAELGAFDVVVMNPPFHMRADIRHILHARRFLRPGGVLAALCLDTGHRVEALRGLAETWEAVPAGAFRAEGTGVACVLLTIRAGVVS